MQINRYYAGTGYATELPTMDFETYSEAGFEWNGSHFYTPKGKKNSIMRVGGWCYAEHPSTEVLILCYDMRDGQGVRRWEPGDPPPQDLFDHIRAGGLIEAHNSFFEYVIWRFACHVKMGWPYLPIAQLRCSAAKAAAWSLPRALAKGSAAIGAPAKDMSKQAQAKKLWSPRKPTKADPALRWSREKYPELYEINAQYCEQDVVSEHGLSIRTPDLSDFELEVWKLDQRINQRGVAIDWALIDAMRAIYEEVAAEMSAEITQITGGINYSEVSQLLGWLNQYGLGLKSLDADAIEAALAREDLHPTLQRVLEIRATLASASVKKIYSLIDHRGRDGRVHDIFMFCGADRTGRWSGSGPQPQNMPSSGPKVAECVGCGQHYWTGLDSCPVCNTAGKAPADWGIKAMDFAIRHIMARDLATVRRMWGDPIKALAGCLRGAFIAGPGAELICSDFSAIEARVLAYLTGEQWRIDVFNSHGLIYEMSAAKTAGVPFEDIMRYKEETGQHHPLRKKVGKVGELASGYQGGINAWKNFGADAFMSDDEIRQAVKDWRNASPMVVKFWEGVEAAAVNAIAQPGKVFAYRDVSYGCKDGVLYCRLPSGRCLSYHKARLVDELTPWGTPTQKIKFWGVESKTKKWMELDTYGGKLTENIVQAVARDLQAAAMLRLDAAGYPIVLHVHDEDVAEVAEGTGSIEHFETIMSQVPDWAAGWNIPAAGGWRGKRYRKD